MNIGLRAVAGCGKVQGGFVLLRRRWAKPPVKSCNIVPPLSIIAQKFDFVTRLQKF